MWSIPEGHIDKNIWKNIRKNDLVFLGNSNEQIPYVGKIITKEAKKHSAEIFDLSDLDAKQRNHFLFIEKMYVKKLSFYDLIQRCEFPKNAEKIPGIVGFAKAVEIAVSEMEQENEKYRKWTEMMLEEFSKIGGKLNGHPAQRLSHNLNVRFDGIEGKAIINSVSKKLAISAGSACTTQNVDPSHVLLAIGLGDEQSHQSIRFGLSRSNTIDDIKIAIREIKDSIFALKCISS